MGCQSEPVGLPVGEFDEKYTGVLRCFDNNSGIQVLVTTTLFIGRSVTLGFVIAHHTSVEDNLP